MGAYENPAIITDKSGEIFAQGMAQFSQSIAQGIEAYGVKAAKQRAAITEEAKKTKEFNNKQDIDSLNRKLTVNKGINEANINNKSVIGVIQERAGAIIDQQTRISKLLNKSNTSEEERKGHLNEYEKYNAQLLDLHSGFESMVTDVNNSVDPTGKFSIGGGDGRSQYENTILTSVLASKTKGEIGYEVDSNGDTVIYTIDPTTQKQIRLNVSRAGEGSDGLVFTPERWDQQLVGEVTDFMSKDKKTGKFPDQLMQTVSISVNKTYEGKDGAKDFTVRELQDTNMLNTQLIDTTLVKAASAKMAGWAVLSDNQKAYIYNESRVEGDPESYLEWVNANESIGEQGREDTMLEKITNAARLDIYEKIEKSGWHKVVGKDGKIAYTEIASSRELAEGGKASAKEPTVAEKKQLKLLNLPLNKKFFIGKDTNKWVQLIKKGETPKQNIYQKMITTDLSPAPDGPEMTYDEVITVL